MLQFSAGNCERKATAATSSINYRTAISATNSSCKSGYTTESGRYLGTTSAEKAATKIQMTDSILKLWRRELWNNNKTKKLRQKQEGKGRSKNKKGKSNAAHIFQKFLAKKPKQFDKQRMDKLLGNRKTIFLGSEVPKRKIEIDRTKQSLWSRLARWMTTRRSRM